MRYGRVQCMWCDVESVHCVCVDSKAAAEGGRCGTVTRRAESAGQKVC